jgi:hypothetical protein
VPDEVVIVEWIQHENRAGTVHAHRTEDTCTSCCFEPVSICGFSSRYQIGKPDKFAPRCRACERIVNGTAGRPMRGGK